MTAPNRVQRRIVPVACVTREGAPDGVHLSLLTWLPQWEEWATGPALCGQSAEQGALPDTTPVTCTGFDGSCESYRDTYQRIIDGRPTAHQEEVTALRAEVTRLTGLVGEYADRAIANGERAEALDAELQRAHASRLTEPVLRHCLFPVCLREFDVRARLCGDKPARPSWSGEGWLQMRGLDGYICPDHAHLVGDRTSPGPHAPQWGFDVPGLLQCVCACGWTSTPARWRGFAVEAWKDHVLTVTEQPTGQGSDTRAG